jgi:hypothetical protein
MPGQVPRRSWFVVALALLIALQAVTPAWAWGRLGHRVISRLAEKKLSPKAVAVVVNVCESKDRESDHDH